jgi:predicted dehydrogenase
MLGFGYWGRNLLRNLIANARCDVVGLCDGREAARREAADKYPDVPGFAGFEEALTQAEADAVVIATPSGLHPEHIRTALSAGCHVFVEKPLAETVEDAVAVTDMARAGGLTLMVGHTFLYNNLVHDVKARIDSGELGDVFCAYSQRLNLGRFRQDSDVLWTLAPHDVSIVNHWFSDRPTHVRARGHAYVHKESGVAEVCYASMDFADGRNAHFHLSWLDPQKRRDMVVVGSRKMLVYDDMNSDQHIRLYDKSAEAEHQSNVASFADHTTRLRAGDLVVPNVKLKEPLAAEIDHFLSCVQTGETPLTDGNHAIEVTAVLEAMTRSMKSAGSTVAVDYPSR